ncbi:ABC transporter substrate-binding protein [Candidatus Laterigemmans baculatus]|uniref:ABC transporter substrate-binding protein n=1 Tax=Candidatus Laterigemmans baculatus TaxID=2770505 RepID=UPI00193B8721|nr:ABC transporter substrate-binding protein [Candidatus Laterigemmans baculatus]
MRIRAAAAILWVCLLGIGLWQATAPSVDSETVGESYLEVTDLAGRKVVLRQPVERVVLLRSLGIYELAAVLGDDIDDRLVGWDSSLESGDHDTYQAFVERFPRLQEIPVLGDSLRDTVSAEAVLALKPDLVILNTYMRDRHHEGVARLEQAGVPLLYLDLSDPFEGPQESVLLLGKVLGKEERAQAIAGWIDQHLDEVFKRLETIQSPAPSIYLEAGTQGAGEYGNTFGTDGHGNAVNWGSVLSQLRCRNVAAESVTGAYGMGRIRPEYLLAVNPEVVVITGAHWSAYQDSLRLGYFADAAESRGQLQKYLSRPGWSELEAVKHDRVHGIHTRFGSHVMSFAAASQIAKWLYPAEFQDFDPEADWREFHERFMPLQYGGTWMVSLRDE